MTDPKEPTRPTQNTRAAPSPERQAQPRPNGQPRNGQPVGSRPNPSQQNQAQRTASNPTQPPQQQGARPAAAPINNKGLNAVVTRNSFYQDGYRNFMRIALIQSIIIAILAIGFIFYAAGQEKQYVYFATSEDGRLIPMVPLNHPNLSNPALLSWVSQASAEVMSFGFNDYRRRLQEASRHFTRTGWQSFTQALQSAQMIETINANKQVVTATPNGAPIIIKESIDTGRYEWLIQVPLLLNYQAGGRSRDERKEILIKVVRVPRLESPNGVGIEQWNVIQGSSQ